MAIAVRSRGQPRSRLETRRRASIEPSDTDAYTIQM